MLIITCCSILVVVVVVVELVVVEVISGVLLTKSNFLYEAEILLIIAEIYF